MKRASIPGLDQLGEAYLRDKLDALDRETAAAFERDSVAFPVGTRVRTRWGSEGTVIGKGPRTLRVRLDDGGIARHTPNALSQI